VYVDKYRESRPTRQHSNRNRPPTETRLSVRIANYFITFYTEKKKFNTTCNASGGKRFTGRLERLLTGLELDCRAVTDGRAPASAVTQLAHDKLYTNEDVPS
jgi:hypothetical protein